MRGIGKLGWAVLAVALLAGCSAPSGDGSAPPPASQASLAELHAAIDDGLECSELFELFDTIDEDSSEFSSAQGELINVGCYSRTSERNDAELSEVAPDSPWLGVPGTRVTPSEACSQAAIAAANETDSSRAEPLIAATLDACVSVDEWMSVVEEYPGIMGMAVACRSFWTFRSSATATSTRRFARTL